MDNDNVVPVVEGEAVEFPVPAQPIAPVVQSGKCPTCGKDKTGDQAS